MLKKLLFISILFSMLTFAFAACGDATSNTSASNSSGSQVHMDSTTFIQPSITIKKGESLTLVSDTVTPHIIANGTWDQGTAKPAKESGAPEVKDVQVNGNSSTSIGPFNTAGTFKLYCTIHPGMNLTVTVQ
ncbi:hypothetical protein EPA93_47815 [Ktedonosporobacter rubrisoli]|uniref:Blue (type 1) copper domain-containing protein n=1 Tax=Ktedonosporobacter rubrisoli TaxID=2509675 RepID=A0A4P6K6M4_KTERU|nr:plastocyanin/azurin family copper-binding protein [Ktedonosporobacter rubrisoli]QBD83266.1 hypothetical protein EPA93_47815 [Ktedonosporobacter rubrisoli]